MLVYFNRKMTAVTDGSEEADHDNKSWTEIGGKKELTADGLR